MAVASIPAGLAPFFQEYDLLNLDLDSDATLVIQRTLEYGTWDEVRWLFVTYGAARVKTFSSAGALAFLGEEQSEKRLDSRGTSNLTESAFGGIVSIVGKDQSLYGRFQPPGVKLGGCFFVPKANGLHL